MGMVACGTGQAHHQTLTKKMARNAPFSIKTVDANRYEQVPEMLKKQTPYATPIGFGNPNVPPK